MTWRRALLTVCALAVQALALAPGVSAMSPPSAITIFTGTGNIQAIDAVDTALHSFCRQYGCKLSRTDLPTKEPWIWFIAFDQQGKDSVMISAAYSHVHGTLSLLAAAPYFCAPSQQALKYKPQLMAAINHAGVPVTPAPEQKCTP